MCFNHIKYKYLHKQNIDTKYDTKYNKRKEDTNVKMG